MSPVALEEVFNGATFGAQPSLIIPEREIYGKLRRDGTLIDPAIARVYSTPPPPGAEDRFTPHVTLDA
ncbi:MAG: hypothetical protein EOP85_22300 [Verrucomicrobiaceae bacterium]|nr:MAG: hypothetical protein EOP85_22300 [Verrucomicrobiaceae bacterium]